MPHFSGPTFALLCLLGLASPPGFAQRKVGVEFQVNVYTPGSQRDPSVSLSAAGSFVVAWRSADQDDYGIFARRFNAPGAAQGLEFQVNSVTASGQVTPTVSLDDDGDFVVAWSSAGQDGDNYGIFARRFTAAGAAQGLEFQVNSHTAGRQYHPSVSLSASGGFVVAWSSSDQDGSSYGAFARRFSAAGIAQGLEFRVNSYTVGAQYGATVSLDAAGDFVVAWSSQNQDGSGYGVFARRFDAAGEAVAVEFQVNTTTTNGQVHPAVALSAAGDFVLAWMSFTQDGSGHGIFARRFSAAGLAQATEFQVNTYTQASQFYPSVSLDDDGDFAVVWTSADQDGSADGVFARSFDSAGVARGPDLQVSRYTTSSQTVPVVSLDAAGGFVVAWNSSAQDGSNNGVFAQRFEAPAVLDIDGDGEALPLTDGLLVLRFLFGFSGAPLVSGAIDLAACTRCTAPAIEGYLQTLI